MTTRLAINGDLDSIVSLTARHRRRLAEWAPTWWRAAPAADDMHRLWLQHVLGSDEPIVRVVEDNGTVVGCAVSMPQPAQWFVDDVVLLDDGRWPDAGAAMLRAIPERPALTCVPTADSARLTTSTAAGLHHVSSYWIRPTEQGAFAPRPISGRDAVPAAPRHSFLGPLDPEADGALAFSDGNGGLVVGSRSFTAPPVYDPGGTVCVVDRVQGPDRGPLLLTALAGAAERGDVLLTVVANHDDRPLQDLLLQAGFDQTVDVFAWPQAG